MVNWRKGETTGLIVPPGEDVVGRIDLPQVSAQVSAQITSNRPPAPAGCPKCGAPVETIILRWHLGDVRMRSDRSDGYDHPHRYCSSVREDHDQYPGEHLHYRCPTCWFDWTGPTRDWSGPSEK